MLGIGRGVGNLEINDINFMFLELGRDLVGEMCIYINLKWNMRSVFCRDKYSM